MDTEEKKRPSVTETKGPAKHAYTPPRLTIHGSVAEITASIGRGLGDAFAAGTLIGIG